MPEIIPAIIPKSFQELADKVKLVESYVKTVQIDVMDGVFVPNMTWPYFVSRGEVANGKSPVEYLNNIKTDVFLEAHLMVDAPHQILNEWLNSQVKRIILHWEAIEKIHNHELLPYKTQISAGFPVSNLSEEIHKRNKEFGIALNLETPISALDNFIGYVDAVLLMSVNPGQGGQEFQPDVIHKLASLRQKYPNVKIGIDGGVNLNNALKLAEAGADFLVIGSAIFKNNQPEKNIKQINDLLGKNK